jgi:hypothetical protein
MFPSFRGTAQGSAYNFANNGSSFSLSGTAVTTLGTFQVIGRVNHYSGTLIFIKNSVPVVAMNVSHGLGSHGINDYHWTATVNGTTYSGEATLQFPTTASFSLTFRT